MYNYAVSAVLVLVSIGIASMAYPVIAQLAAHVASSARINEAAEADLAEINSRIATHKRTVEFTYKAPFAQFGEGFVLTDSRHPAIVRGIS